MSINVSDAMKMYCDAIISPNLSCRDPGPYNAAVLRLSAAYIEKFLISEADARELVSNVGREWVNVYYDSDGAG